MKETKIGAEIGWGKNLVIFYITNNQLVHKRLHTNAHFPPQSPSSFQAIFKKYIMTNSDWIILDKIDFVLKRVRKQKFSFWVSMARTEINHLHIKQNLGILLFRRGAARWIERARKLIFHFFRYTILFFGQNAFFSFFSLSEIFSYKTVKRRRSCRSRDCNTDITSLKRSSVVVYTKFKYRYVE